jgi:hypothetical protein
VKTTIEIPEELFREAKAAAAREGRSFRDLFTSSLREHLERSNRESTVEAWRVVFGSASDAEVGTVDEVIEADLDRVDLETWR